jgi:hypothetical protein
MADPQHVVVAALRNETKRRVLDVLERCHARDRHGIGFQCTASQSNPGHAPSSRQTRANAPGSLDGGKGKRATRSGKQEPDGDPAN